MSNYYERCPKCGRFIKRRRQKQCAHCGWKKPRGAVALPQPQKVKNQ